MAPVIVGFADAMMDCPVLPGNAAYVVRYPSTTIPPVGYPTSVARVIVPLKSIGRSSLIPEFRTLPPPSKIASIVEIMTLDDNDANSAVHPDDAGSAHTKSAPGPADCTNNPEFPAPNRAHPADPRCKRSPRCSTGIVSRVASTIPVGVVISTAFAPT